MSIDPAAVLAPLQTQRFETITGDGWRLALKRVVAPAAFDSDLNPLVMIPGYGMNAFIFGYHPSGQSMEAFFARDGFEVWSVELRGQGRSTHPNGRGDYGLAEMALDDLRALFDFVCARTDTSADAVHALGCSLGGSLLFAHLACESSRRVASVVAMGAPLCWRDVHPVIRTAFSPVVAGLLPHRGMRRWASVLFPLALKVPKSLHIYLHPEITDCSDYKMLLNTVDDTSPSVNRQLATWIRQQDLIIQGRNVTNLLKTVDLPLLCVVANADGIVPERSATAAVEVWGGEAEILRVGDDSLRFAHADLFVSRHSEALVFEPISRWLLAH